MRLLVSGATVTMNSLAKKASVSPYLGHLLTPANGNKLSSLLRTGLPFACDNAAFSSFCPQAFKKMVCRVIDYGKAPLWIACPDVVGDAEQTLRRFEEWRFFLHGLPIAFVAQDGCETVGLPWDEISAVFIGGSTEWKLSRSAARVCDKAKNRGKLLHMGRVNSLRRLRLAVSWGCDSIDGTSLSMFRGSVH